MSIITSLGIVILAMLIMASLELSPGVFALFYHSALGKYSKAKASDLSLFFILGVEVISTCLFLSAYYFTHVFFLNYSGPSNTILVWVTAGVLIALGFASLFFYFRRSSGTELFVSRHFATSLIHHTSTVKTRSDAFTLGALSSTSELIFTLPLYFITAIELTDMSTSHFTSNLLTILYIVVSTIPLFLIRWRYQVGQNLADIQKSRVKNKPFTRLILSFSYFAIAILIICFKA